MRRLILCLALLLSLPVLALAETYHATVMAVHDGDTVTLDTGQRIRLWGVDAPEEAGRKWRQQPGADGARDYLSSLVMHQVVEVQVKGRSYDRAVARLTLPDGRDVSALMVAAGWAWVEPRYCKAKKVCGPMRDAQEAAVSAKAGLWEHEAVPPWEWRHGVQ